MQAVMHKKKKNERESLLYFGQSSTRSYLISMVFLMIMDEFN